MRDNVLWRKQSHIILMLAETLNIDAERALDLYYSTHTAQQLSDARYGLQLMSDHYILDDILEEIRAQSEKSSTETPTPSKPCQ